MNTREITVGGLSDFVKSKEYSQLNPKPITWLRAISQSKNPDAKKDDVVLVFASENNVLLGFVGLLPNSVNSTSQKIFSNTGWWAHPELGKNLGLPLFLKAFQFCGNQMFFTDCTTHTKSILEKTGLFYFMPPNAGTRFFLRFYFGVMLRKKKRFEFALPVISLFDKISNAILSPTFSLWIKKVEEKKHTVSFTNNLEAGLDGFIKKHSTNKYLIQSAGKLNWIIRNPWITTNKTEQLEEYPFTHVVDNFRQEFLIIKKDNVVKAVLMLSLRDNHLSVPFVYYDSDSLDIVAKKIWYFALNNKVNSLMIFNHELLAALNKAGSPAIYKSKIIRYSGYSKNMDAIFAEGKQFQDGEADVAFT